MRSRALRHSVEMQRQAVVGDAEHGVRSWLTYRTTKAMVMPRTGKEYENAERAIGETVVHFKVRGSTDPGKSTRTGDRIVFDGENYYVEAALDFQARNRDITIPAVWRSDR